MIYLTKRLEFSAGHRLYSDRLTAEENEKLFGKCARASGHGHNYTLEVTVSGKPDPITGMVINLSEFKALLEERIIAELDHRNLSDPIPLLRGRIPTTENLAVSIWETLTGKLPAGRLHEVKVWETSSNWAAYRGEE
jgi:6-pyruvoyltetrahydropterin/6-carboxytetrahydropterin synthase